MFEGLSRRHMLAGAASLAAAPAMRAAAAEGPVRVGVLTDQTGPYADSGGAGSVLAARMAAQDFGPTVIGRGIEIIEGDTRNKPDVAGVIARQWYDSGVDVIVDLPVTPVAAAVQQIAREKNRSVMITASVLSEFTSKWCSPVSSHWADDVHTLALGATRLLTETGKTWFFITVDFSFGDALMAEATRAVAAKQGKVLGSIKFPIGATDFGTQILQAQSSGADFIGLIAVGNDQVNLIKQSVEFGLTRGGAHVACFLIYITDIHALGLDVTQGLTFPAGFYWDQSDVSRAFAKRFMAEQKAAPTKNQAGIYASVSHYLRAMAEAGTADAVAVNKAMRARPVDYLGRPATLRADGRLLYDVTLYRVKSPAGSHAPWDYYTAAGTLPAAEAFLPANPACVA